MLPTLLAAFSLCSLTTAPVPAEKPKPPTKPKFLGTLKVENNPQQLLWSPDGQFLLVIGTEHVVVFRRSDFGDATAKPVAKFNIPACNTLRIHIPTMTLYGMTMASGFTSETQLHRWNLKPILKGESPKKPDESMTIDFQTSEAHLTRLSNDGKELIVVQRKTNRERPNGENAGFSGGSTVSRFSTRDGERVVDEKKIDDLIGLTSMLNGGDPSSFLGVRRKDDKVSIARYDVVKDKPVFDVDIANTADVGMRIDLKDSPSGNRIAIRYNTIQNNPNGNRPPGAAGGPVGWGGPQSTFGPTQLIILDGTTGKSLKIETLQENVELLAFSQDEEFLVTRTSNGTQNATLSVRKTDTLAVVKSWPISNLRYSRDTESPWGGGRGAGGARPVTILSAFSPNDNALALVEESTNTLALWDFTGLEK